MSKVTIVGVGLIPAPGITVRDGEVLRTLFVDEEQVREAAKRLGEEAEVRLVFEERFVPVDPDAADAREAAKEAREVMETYALLREQGRSPKQVYLRMRHDGVPTAAAMGCLRKLFDLSLRDAKEVVIQVDTNASSLDEYQGQLLPDLEKVFVAASLDGAVADPVT